MARRRRRHFRRARRFYSRRERGIGGAITGATAVLSFISQITGKDIAVINSQPTAMDKGKQIVNSITGRITGISFFQTNSVGQALTKPPQTINPAGMVNKYTGLGVAALLYSAYAPKRFPFKGVVKKFGSGLVAGGVAGGLFDDPVYNRTNAPNMQLQSGQIGSGNSSAQSGRMLA